MITGLKKLAVGCTASMIMTQHTDFVVSMSLGIGDSTDGVYSIVLPTSDRSYCTLQSTQIIDTLYNDVAQPGAAIASASCSSPPCLSVDIFSTAQISTIKFKVESTFPNSLVHVSDQVTISIDCSNSDN